MKKIKKFIMYILIFIPVSNGFSVSRAKRWVRKIYSNLKNNKEYTFIEKIRAYRYGYMPRHIDRFNITGKNCGKFISLKDYYYLQPINGLYRKWLADKVIVRKIFSPFKNHMQKLYYQISMKNGDISVTALDDCPYKAQTRDSVIKLIKAKKKLVVTDSVRNRNAIILYENGTFSFQNELIYDEEELFCKIIDFHYKAIIAEYIKPAEAFANEYHSFGNILRLVLFHEPGRSPQIGEAFIRTDAHYTDDVELLAYDIESAYGIDISNLKKQESKDDFIKKKKFFRGIISHINMEDGSYENGRAVIGSQLIEVAHRIGGKQLKGKIPFWKEIKEFAYNICNYVPQLEFFAIDILITEKDFKCVRFLNIPSYPSTQPYGEKTTEFLRRKVCSKKENYSFTAKGKRGFKKIKLKVRSIFARLFFPKGLKPYLSVRWIKEVCTDFFLNHDISLKKKVWAYRHGFLPYRLEQYGITENNYLDFISDFEYKWLRHINGKSRIWFEDKVTFKYILSQYKEFFPEYYYQVCRIGDENRLIPMMDCTKKDEPLFDDIFELVKEKGVLALKPDEGSHGDGFYKLSWENGVFCLNGKKSDEKGVLKILKDQENQYLVTEYIDNHPQFRAIYDGAVNTIRMIVFKKDGITPQIGNAYMRFGSKRTGAVDNMGAGGMFVQVDIETGRYGNAKIILDHSIKECPHHPDTGVLIEGVIPHWNMIKNTVLEIASEVKQLEYFGFDIAVTEDGLKFPEINRFPDYPKIEKFSRETIEYLLIKLDEKKRRYGYDLKPCRKLVHLPKR